MYRFRILLTCVVATFAALVTPAVAQAADTTVVPVVADAVPLGASTALAASRGCPLPYLSTAYGPVGQCTVISGGSGSAGKYSPITGGFNATVGPLTVYRAQYYSWNGGTVRGYYSLQTAYGPGVWATQYSGNRGRWGTVNLITSEFHAAGGWLPTV